MSLGESLVNILKNKIIFSEAAGLIQTGSERLVDSKDRLQLPEQLSSYSEEINLDQLDISTDRTLYFSLFKVSQKIIKSAVIFQIMGSLFAFSTPILIHAFISRLQMANWTDRTLYELIFLAIGFGLSGAGNGLSIQHYFFRTLKFSMITNNLINKKIYAHSLKLTAAAKQKYQVGDIVNFMSSDSDTLGDAAMVTIDMVNTAVLLVGCSGLLFYYMGWSASAAIVIMAVLVPMTQRLAKKFVHLEEQMMSHRDTRMTLMTQILNSIRVVKYFSWEKSVQSEVTEIRNKEISARYKVAKSEIGWGLIYSSISTVTLFAALLTHYYRGQKIDLALVLTCISVFSLMEDQFGGMSRFISRFMNIFVSCRRITDFLKSETLNVQTLDAAKFETTNQENALEVKNLNFSYSAHDVKNTNENTNPTVILRNLNFNVPKGQSLAIIGSVGAGKTTLLHLFLKELNPSSGELKIQAALKKGFIPQEAFIINSTLQENIIFGEPFTDAQLQQAIDLACLRADVNILPSGLDTEIGEKGVNLSGGQKQRVSLARTILADPDIIFLDDPLSAVDPQTEKLLCDYLIFGAWKNKTRIMATHRIAELKKFDQILFLLEGRYVLGTYDELFSSSNEFKKFLEIESKNQSHEIETQKQEAPKSILNAPIPSDGRVTVDEDREKGSVKADVYWTYIKSLGGDSPRRNFFIFLLFFGAMAHTLAPMMQRTWLTQMNTQVSPLNLVIGYGLFGLLTLLISSASGLWWTLRGISAGRLLHDKMLKSVLKSQIRFFDSTPIGRILQRFSRDMESVDIFLQWSFDSAIHTLFNVISAFLLIIIALPVSLFILTPIMYLYYTLQLKYRKVAREVKRLDSLARSPRYAHFKETLQGLTVIRSFHAQDWFQQQFLKKLNYSTEMTYTHIMLNRWFSSRLPLVGSAISMTTALGVVLATYKGWLGAGLSGLVTLYALEFWRHLNWGVRIFSDLESRMTSVERLNFYANLPAEKDDAVLDQFVKENPHWPQSGSLEFKKVVLRYADHLPNVLKGVSFSIGSGSRAGIVGRTGSGKSTLFQAVFRFVHFNEGDILFDGVSVNKIPLEVLRKNLSVIPQDPSLFLGSLRSNLDRYAEKSDQEVWAVLEKVGLKYFIQQLPNQLNYAINEGGSNLSQGQRQLICLARALLMKVKIIFLDEATASVDIETDALIQHVIRTSLDGITLVTIAHRLSTLKGYDSIIELQNGEVVSKSSLSQPLLV